MTTHNTKYFTGKEITYARKVDVKRMRMVNNSNSERKEKTTKNTKVTMPNLTPDDREAKRRRTTLRQQIS